MRGETYVPSTGEFFTAKELHDMTFASDEGPKSFEESPFHKFDCMMQAEAYLEDWKLEHEECFKIALNSGVKTKDQALSFMFLHMSHIDFEDFGPKSWGPSYFDKLWKNRVSWKKKAKRTEESLTI
jgi:hypothetical protein